MRHLWSILCVRTLVDETTKNVSLIEVIDEVQLRPTEPVTPERPLVVAVQWVFATTWVRSDLATPEVVFQQRVRVEGSRGTTVVAGEPVDVNLRDFLRLRAMAQIAQFVVDGEGPHYIVVDSRLTPDAEWTEQGRVPVMIRFEAP